MNKKTKKNNGQPISQSTTLYFMLNLGLMKSQTREKTATEMKVSLHLQSVWTRTTFLRSTAKTSFKPSSILMKSTKVTSYVSNMSTQLSTLNKLLVWTFAYANSWLLQLRARASMFGITTHATWKSHINASLVRRWQLWPSIPQASIL